MAKDIKLNADDYEALDKKRYVGKLNNNSIIKHYDNSTILQITLNRDFINELESKGDGLIKITDEMYLSIYDVLIILNDYYDERVTYKNDYTRVLKKYDGEKVNLSVYYDDDLPFIFQFYGYKAKSIYYVVSPFYERNIQDINDKLNAITTKIVG